MEEALLSRPQRSTDLEDACFSTQKKVPGIYYIPSNESVVVVRRYNPNNIIPHISNKNLDRIHISQLF